MPTLHAPAWVMFTFILLPGFTGAANEFSVSCPHRTTVSILSAFYGRRISSQNLCPSIFGGSEENMFCSSPNTLQKLHDECQDRRSCHFSVNSRIFGSDPCPGTHKYLLVSYKCKPDHYKVRSICENEQLYLTCKNNSLLSIYSAHYGRTQKKKIECELENRTIPDYECSAQTALRKVSRICHRRHNCTITADTKTFGDPCFPGVPKYLTVSYTCVPRRLLEEFGTISHDPFALSDYTHGGWYTGPRLSRLTEDVMILNGCLEIFALIQDMPEKVALYFLCGVTAGLVMLLCIITPKMTVFKDMRKAFWEPQKTEEPMLGGIKLVVRRIDESRDNEDSSSESSFRRLSRSFLFPNNIFSPEATTPQDEANHIRSQNADDMWKPKEASPYAIQKIEESPN
ncbi:protein eva-1 homolog C isoform X2 [Xenopus laevis]|uniref:Protein eva-1 homolog C isoform X2 n=1 Tax=Xenopus laevis TaxID=8355 RepID=A0A8J1LII8_XENLA|nr:protein eva-1 homolog C isoform X2 [Xenopus laevis]